jgi:hypothetical protein
MRWSQVRAVCQHFHTAEPVQDAGCQDFWGDSFWRLRKFISCELNDRLLSTPARLRTVRTWSRANGF